MSLFLGLAIYSALVAFIYGALVLFSALAATVRDGLEMSPRLETSCRFCFLAVRVQQRKFRI